MLQVRGGRGGWQEELKEKGKCWKEKMEKKDKKKQKGIMSEEEKEKINNFTTVVVASATYDL